MFRRGGESVAYRFGAATKVHTTFADGSELVEEYDASGACAVRKRRRLGAMGARGRWEVLLGDVPAAGASTSSGSSSTADSLLVQESSSNVSQRLGAAAPAAWRRLLCACAASGAR
jgi:hypothetical protein